MPSDLTISIINHSNPQMLHECLRSLFATTHTVSLDVWVVDNATSGAGVPEMQAAFPQVHWLFNEQRLGFSANHNQVLRQATGRYACILNDDIVVHEGAFDALVAYMNANPKVGMAGARLLNGDGTQQNCTFHSVTLLSELIGLCHLPKVLTHLKTLSIDEAQYGTVTTQVDWVLGACIVVKQSALTEIGLLDAVLSPIGNGEEVDWCLRAYQSGWSVVYCPQAVLTHYGRQSFQRQGSSADAIQIEFKRTAIRYARKHMGRGKMLVLRALFVVTMPWNLFMLTQSLIRTRSGWRKYQTDIRTIIAIAKVGVSKA